MFILYLTRNNVNNKIYIGVHSQSIFGFDGYLGSGSILHHAIKKYGRHNFIRETLRICDSYWEAFRLESLAVDEKFISRSDTYNRKLGGFGGWTNKNKRWNAAQHLKCPKRGERNGMFGKNHAQISKEKMSREKTIQYQNLSEREKLRRRQILIDVNTGRKLSPDHRKLITGRPPKNPNDFILVSPEGDRFEIPFKNLGPFCEEWKISGSVLRKNLNRGKIQKRSRHTSLTGKNSVGWTIQQSGPSNNSSTSSSEIG